MLDIRNQRLDFSNMIVVWILLEKIETDCLMKHDKLGAKRSWKWKRLQRLDDRPM
jgi:hypothetical protein